MKDRARHGFAQRLKRATVRRYKVGISRPQFFDGKIRSEQASRRTKYPEGFAHDGGDVIRIVAMDESAERGKFGDDIGPRGEELHTGAPSRPPDWGEVFQHTGVLKNEGHSRAARGEFRRALHLPGEDLEIEAPNVVGEARDVSLQCDISREIRFGREPVLRILVPMELHAQAAHAWIFGQAIELWPHIGRKEIGIADDRVRVAGFGGCALDIGDFVLKSILGPIGLNINRFRHAAAGDVGQKFADRIVAPDRLVRAEDARLQRPVEPRQVRPSPDVVVGVDNCGHAALAFAKLRTWAQILSTVPPSASTSRNGRAATRPAVRGSKLGSAASGVSQTTCQASWAKRAIAARSAPGSPRSRPSESTTTAAPRASAAKRGMDSKAPSASPRRVPPSQSATRNETAVSACSRSRMRTARVMRVSLVPTVNTSTASAARASACANLRCAWVRSFIEPDTSISTTMRRWRSRRLLRCTRTNSPALRIASRNMRRASTRNPLRALRQR